MVELDYAMTRMFPCRNSKLRTKPKVMVDGFEIQIELQLLTKILFF